METEQYSDLMKVCNKYKNLIAEYEEALQTPRHPNTEASIRLSIKDLSQNLFMLKLEALRYGVITQDQYNDI
jgi:ABC-type antimicrobial peptide transport system ATPase subunit